MSITTLDDIRQLSVSERIQLVEDIWDTIAATPDQLPLTQAQMDELDRRAESYRQNPEATVAWQQVRDKITGIE